MSNIYLMFINATQNAVDWITYCRAHMLYEALPNCAGIYRMAQPPVKLKLAPEGWNLYVLCHGDKTTIGGLSGTILADRLSKVIPAKNLGFIHLQSCQTGGQPAEEFATRLGKLGHHVIVKAPAANATFTEEIGFRVLDVGSFTPQLKAEYNRLVSNHKQAGKRAAESASGSGDLRCLCRNVYRATIPFWKEFSKLFKKCAMPTGAGWRAYETTPPKGSRPIP